MKYLFLTLSSLALILGANAQETAISITASQLPYTLASAEAAQGGTGVQYRWYKNGVEIPGATAATYAVPAAEYPTAPANPATGGTKVLTYARAAKCAECTEWLFSNPISVTICAAATLPTVALDYTCANNQMATVTYTGGNGADRYSWGYPNGDTVTYDPFSAATSNTPPLGDVITTRLVKARNSANGCISSQPASLTMRLPEKPTLVGAVPIISHTVNRVSSNAVSFTISTFAGGSGAAHAQAYGYAFDAHSAAAPAMTWQASNVRGAATVTLPATAVAGGVAPSLFLQTRDSKGCVSRAEKVPIHPTIPAGTNMAFCASCGYNGSAWVDAWATLDAGQTVVFGDKDSLYRTSKDDGRDNSRLMASLTGIKACTDRGTGWYLPAVNELDKELITLNRCVTMGGSIVVSTEQSATHMLTLWNDNTGAYYTSACPTKNYHRARKRGPIVGTDNYGTIVRSCMWRP